MQTFFNFCIPLERKISVRSAVKKENGYRLFSIWTLETSGTSQNALSTLILLNIFVYVSKQLPSNLHLVCYIIITSLQTLNDP